MSALPLTQTRIKTRSQVKKRQRIEQEKQEAKDHLFEGLQLTRTGQYVKVDENLLRRLKNPEEVVEEIHVNPFENSPEFMETLRNGTELSFEFLNQCSEYIQSDPDSRKMAEMVPNLPVDWLSLKRTGMKEDDWNYSVKLSVNPRVTDQCHSGRCWLYASLGMMRYALMRQLNLDYKFEFSETYLYFYDKIERSNMFLEYIWTLRNRSLQDQLVQFFTNFSSHMLNDGGTFTYFLNLSRKYGLVPKNVYSEAYNSLVSGEMNDKLITVLNHMAYNIFNNPNMTQEQFFYLKTEYMTTIYDLVVRFLGEPPKPTDTFTWTFKDGNGDSQSVPNMTPEKFYRVVVPHENDTKIVIINDPRHEETYFSNSWGEHSVNVVGGTPLPMVNLPMDEFKKVICESLKNDTAVWFGADIGKCFDYENNTSDTNRFDYKSVLGTDVQFDKSDMLDMLTALPNHALIFNGVDTIEDQDGNVLGYKKWRVENSWGLKYDLESEEDFGYYRMMDDYVDKYVFMAVVDLKYFDPEVLSKIMKNNQEGKSYTYSPYDAFGTLARPCSHCRKDRPKRPSFK